MNQPQSRARQVDSVLSADGGRPARRRRRVSQQSSRLSRQVRYWQIKDRSGPVFRNRNVVLVRTPRKTSVAVREL